MVGSWATVSDTCTGDVRPVVVVGVTVSVTYRSKTQRSRCALLLVQTRSYLFDLGAFQNGRQVRAVHQCHCVGHFGPNFLLVDDNDALLEMRKHLTVVTHEKRLGHEGQFLGILRRQFQRRRHPIRDDVVHVRSSTGARVAEPHDLNRSRAQGEDFIASTFRVSIHVDQDVDAVGVDPVSRLPITYHLQSDRRRVMNSESTLPANIPEHPPTTLLASGTSHEIATRQQRDADDSAGDNKSTHRPGGGAQ